MDVLRGGLVLRLLAAERQKAVLRKVFNGFQLTVSGAGVDVLWPPMARMDSSLVFPRFPSNAATGSDCTISHIEFAVQTLLCR